MKRNGLLLAFLPILVGVDCGKDAPSTPLMGTYFCGYRSLNQNNVVDVIESSFASMSVDCPGTVSIYDEGGVDASAGSDAGTGLSRYCSAPRNLRARSEAFRREIVNREAVSASVDTLFWRPFEGDERRAPRTLGAVVASASRWVLSPPLIVNGLRAEEYAVPVVRSRADRFGYQFNCAGFLSLHAEASAGVTGGVGNIAASVQTALSQNQSASFITVGGTFLSPIYMTLRSDAPYDNADARRLLMLNIWSRYLEGMPSSVRMLREFTGIFVGQFSSLVARADLQATLSADANLALASTSFTSSLGVRNEEGGVYASYKVVVFSRADNLLQEDANWFSLPSPEEIEASVTGFSVVLAERDTNNQPISPLPASGQHAHAWLADGVPASLCNSQWELQQGNHPDIYENARIVGQVEQGAPSRCRFVVSGQVRLGVPRSTSVFLDFRARSTRGLSRSDGRGTAFIGIDFRGAIRTGG